ncbi:hypothetical protein F0U60_24610 [Archangium minus]|uniref:Uncharacterized protein n=1 Tax=Archangium minus TaxID=83450 RepID=A0ABY9WVZ9_9BACT|nr:hypothetical protein F0U60_24610 [Archangium minus]
MTPTTLLLLSALATAQPTNGETVPPRHQLSLYTHSGATMYLSPARTQGGVGGGIGLRDTVDGRWLLQVDASGLTALGSVLAVRVGAGVQRQGWWSPAALVNLTGLFGDRIDFLSSERLLPVQGPSLGLGLTLAPARFNLGRTQVSVMEVGLGVGTDRPELGVLYGLTLLEVGVSL